MKNFSILSRSLFFYLFIISALFPYQALGQSATRGFAMHAVNPAVEDKLAESIPQWNPLPTNVWKNSSSVIFLENGTYTILFSRIIDFYKPTNRTEVVNGDTLTKVITNYFDYSNNLSVVISGVSGGADAVWRLSSYPELEYTNSSFYAAHSGGIFTNNLQFTTIPTGTYSLSFNSVLGHKSPAATSVNITGGPADWYSTNTYIPYSNSLTVSVIGYPAGNCAWTFTSPSDFTNVAGYMPTYTNNVSFSSVPTGTYTFNWPGVVGYITPTQTLDITGATLANTVTGIYVLAYPTNITTGEGIQKFYQRAYFLTNVFLHDSGIPLHQRIAGPLSSETDPYFASWILTNGYVKTEVDPIWTGASNTVVYANDSRLDDARTPLAHSQSISTITDAAPVAASGNYDDLTNAPAIPSTNYLASTNWVIAQGYLTNETYLGTITGGTVVTGATAGVTTNGGVLAFTVPSGGGAGIDTNTSYIYANGTTQSVDSAIVRSKLYMTNSASTNIPAEVLPMSDPAFDGLRYVRKNGAWVDSGLLAIEGATNALNANKLNLSGGIMTGALTNTVLFAGNGAGLTNLQNAEVIKYTGNTTTTAGKIYQWATSVWNVAVCTNENMCNRMIAVALGTNSTTAGMLLLGETTVTNNTLSPGAGIYVSATAGEWTQTVPTNSGYAIRFIGYAIETNKIYFRPDGVWGGIP